MKIKNDSVSFGERVKLDYKQLRALGEDAVRVAERIKPELEKRGDNSLFHISRGYALNPNMKDFATMSDMYVPTSKIVVAAKKVATTFGESVRNLFKVSSWRVAATGDFSLDTVRYAAKRAEDDALASKGESVFDYIARLLSGPEGSIGPR